MKKTLRKQIIKIRKDNNISTIESKLKYYRLNMYYRIRETHSIAYLNDKEYVNNELKTLDTHINKLKQNIINNNKEMLSDIPIYKSPNETRKNNIENKILQSGDTSIMNMDNKLFKFYSKLVLTTKI